MTTDALGSVRVVSNSFGEIKARRDFLPFGEEIEANIGSRTTTQKYSALGDDTRKKFATYQRDEETGLDFAQSRYYSPMQGRFTSPDEFKGGPDELFDFEEAASSNPTFYADLTNPQSLNKYQYGYNNPYKYNDPSGHCPKCLIAAEVALTIWDVVETVKTWRNPNASATEKLVTTGGTILGIFAPGGGYSIAGKAIVKASQGAKATKQAVSKGSGTLGTRANEIHSKLKPGTQKRTTTAVTKAKTKDGKNVKLVSSSEGSLRPSQRKALRKGEIAVKGKRGTHAEVNGINYAKQNNMKVKKVGASRPICDDCANEIKKAGAKPDSPLKNQ